MRELTPVLLITPNVGEVKFESGSANCAWLKALKNSAQSSIELPSYGQANGIVLDAAKSRLSVRDLLQCRSRCLRTVPFPSAPMICGDAKQNELK